MRLRRKMKKKVIASFLSDRKHYVVHGLKQSTRFENNIGAPLGSIFGSLLFFSFFDHQPQSSSKKLSISSEVLLEIHGCLVAVS